MDKSAATPDEKRPNWVRGKEEWRPYVARVRPLVANIPDAVFDQWELANLEKVQGLDPTKLIFSLKTIANAEVLSEVRHWNEPGVEMEV